MSKILITQELVDKLNFDIEVNNINSELATSANTNSATGKPTVLIVFANSDINSALHYLCKSFKSPFDADAIATVIVQESIKDDFIDKLQQQLNSFSYTTEISNEQFRKSLETARKMKARLITVKNQESNEYRPTIVCEFTHEFLGATSPTGVVTLHSFRTAKEAIALVNAESLEFGNVSIWHENHAYAYEIVAALKSENFFINCQKMPLNVLQKGVEHLKNYVCMDKSYHYETLQHEGVQKSIVFPFGSIFAN